MLFFLFFGVLSGLFIYFAFLILLLLFPFLVFLDHEIVEDAGNFLCHAYLLLLHTALDLSFEVFDHVLVVIDFVGDLG